LRRAQAPHARSQALQVHSLSQSGKFLTDLRKEESAEEASVLGENDTTEGRKSTFSNQVVFLPGEL